MPKKKVTPPPDDDGGFIELNNLQELQALLNREKARKVEADEVDEQFYEVDSLEELEALRKKVDKKRPKYNNQHVKFDGYTFDSLAECRYYVYLKSLHEQRKISKVKVHPTYDLIPPFVDYLGNSHRGIKYEADFEYYDETGRLIVVDVKGVMTDVFRIKAELFLWKRQHSSYLVIVDATTMEEKIYGHKSETPPLL